MLVAERSMSKLSSYVDCGWQQHPQGSDGPLPSQCALPSKAPEHAPSTCSKVCTGPVVVLLRGQEAQKQNEDILAPSPFPVEGQARKQIKWIILNPD